MAPGAQELRQRMVEGQLRRRGLADARVLEAMGRVQRHLFVSYHSLAEAYGDHPLSIGQGQTISQPYMVARMTELAAPRGSERALEVGAGCGYQTAILAELCGLVFACELLPGLAHQAAARLTELGYGSERVVLEARDGSVGWLDHAPFDIILVAAGAPEVPAPLLEQLAEGGRLVIPLGGQQRQVLQRITRRNGRLETTMDTPCRFVDLRGVHGWGGER